MRNRFSLLALIFLIIVIALITLIPILALAQDGEAPHDKVKLGEYAMPAVLMVILSLIFWLAEDTIPNRYKPLIAIGVGIGLGILAMFRAELEPNFINIVDYVLFGLMAGAAAIGLYESKKALSRGHR